MTEIPFETEHAQCTGSHCAAASLQCPYAAGSLTADDILARITARLDRADAAIWHDGAAWYANARQWAAEYGAGVGIAAGTVSAVMAALSPNTRWNANLSGTVKMIDAYVAGKPMPKGCTLYNANASKGWRILTGAAPETVLGGNKVISFHRNLTGDETAVTVDTWIWRGTGMLGTLTNRRYGIVAEAYRMAAARYSITPAQCQAMDWIALRGSAE